MKVMKNCKNIFALLVIALMGLSLVGCSNEDDLDTNQYLGDVALNVYGPSPLMRGGTLRFLGSNLDQVAQVEIPGIAAITSIEVVKSGVPSEIRVVVPHDGPQEGFVKLITKSGKELTTKTKLAFTQGLNPANITMPAKAKAGDKIRITVPETGDEYLDIIHMVEFADGVLVGEAAFSAHNRYVIELTVPEEAQTGKLTLYTADLTTAEAAVGDLDYQMIQTETTLEIQQPATTKIASPRGEAGGQGTVTAKAGETIVLSGSLYNIVAGVKAGGIAVAEPQITAQTITFALPAEAPDGDIVLVCKSGVEVVAGSFVTVKPTKAVAAPVPVKAGKALTISGADMNLVTSVEFPNADAQSGEAIQVAADKVVVAAVPDKATEGNLVLRMANGSGVEVPFKLVMPTVTGYDHSSVSAGGALTIKGTDLDLIKTVKFGDSDIVKVEGSETAIALHVPMNAQNGKPTLALANGVTIEGPELNISEALFCYITEMPGEDVELKAGGTLSVPVANGDKLTSVQIKGADCQYVLVNNKTQLIIGVPDNAGKGSEVKLISSNGSISYKLDFIPNTEVTTVLWTGTADLAGWSWNWEVGKGTQGDDNPNMFVDMDLQEGDIIRIYLTAYNDWWQVQFFDGHWAGQTEIGVATGLENGNNINSGIYNLEEHGGCIEIPVTATLREQLTTLTDWGMCWIIQGEGVVVTKIAATHYVSLETVVWTGEAVADDWGNQPMLLSDGATELLEAGLKVGSIIRCYLTPTDASWNCQVYDGHWHGQFVGCDFNQDNWNLADHNGAIEFTVTDAIFAELTTPGGWGSSFLLNGDNVICTKVTIE